MGFSWIDTYGAGLEGGGVGRVWLNWIERNTRNREDDTYAKEESSATI